MKGKLNELPFRIKKVLKEISKQAKTSKVRIYLVGGIARDLILNRAHFDLDIVVEGDAISFVMRLAKHFGVYFKKHHAFGTATVYFKDFKIDFATARKEHYPHWGALPKVEPASLREDLFRRDFTINAIAIGLNNDDWGKIIDFYGGIQDLKKRIIRILHKNSFLEDPTRILRAIRFEQRFLFKIERNTFTLMREAITKKALSWVHPHRLRDEITLILKEPEPYRYLKRIKKLCDFSFIHHKIDLKKEDFNLFLRIKRAIYFYKKKFPKYRELEGWILYLTGLLLKLPKKDILEILSNFGFKKSERIRVVSIKDNLYKIKKLNKKMKPHRVYSIINPLSFEAILFFYAYYTDRKIRKNIRFFLEKLVGVYLKIKGSDLKKIKISPSTIYGKILEKVLYAKIDRGLSTKKEELRLAKSIFKKMIK
jgi:tRNA nucleotidyltransferase (CCA-adding enzyme)